MKKIIRIKDFSIIHNDFGQSLLACDRFLHIECIQGAAPLEAVISIEDDMEIRVDVPVERMPSQVQKRFPKGLSYIFSSEKDLVSPDKTQMLLFWTSANYDYSVPLNLQFGFREDDQ